MISISPFGDKDTHGEQTILIKEIELRRYDHEFIACCRSLFSIIFAGRSIPLAVITKGKTNLMLPFHHLITRLPALLFLVLVIHPFVPTMAQAITSSQKNAPPKNFGQTLSVEPRNLRFDAVPVGSSLVLKSNYITTAQKR